VPGAPKRRRPDRHSRPRVHALEVLRFGKLGPKGVRQSGEPGGRDWRPRSPTAGSGRRRRMPSRPTRPPRTPSRAPGALGACCALRFAARQAPRSLLPRGSVPAPRAGSQSLRGRRPRDLAYGEARNLLRDAMRNRLLGAVNDSRAQRPDRTFERRRARTGATESTSAAGSAWRSSPLLEAHRVARSGRRTLGRSARSRAPAGDIDQPTFSLASLAGTRSAAGASSFRPSGFTCAWAFAPMFSIVQLPSKITPSSITSAGARMLP